MSAWQATMEEMCFLWDTAMFSTGGAQSYEDMIRTFAVPGLD
jgi:hypothetical protein